jgi:hypothetical protein
MDIEKRETAFVEAVNFRYLNSKSLLYYSKEEFEKLISFIKPVTESYFLRYIDMMKFVLFWMDLVKSSISLGYPHIWIDQDG